MKRNIIVAKKALSADLCNTIIERAKPRFEAGKVGGGGQKNSIRKSEISWLNGIVRHLDIYIPVLQLIDKVNRDFYNFDLAFPEDFQITRYDESKN